MAESPTLRGAVESYWMDRPETTRYPALGLDQMSRSDAILAAIEERHVQEAGHDAYRRLKEILGQLGRRQRHWRDDDR